MQIVNQQRKDHMFVRVRLKIILDFVYMVTCVAVFLWNDNLKSESFQFVKVPTEINIYHNKQTYNLQRN